MKETKDILKQLRTERGMSQAQLANILHISASAIGNYESGIRSPKREIMELFADYFNVDLGYLYGMTDVRNEYRGIKDVESKPSFAQLIGARIKQARLDKKLTQEELANATGITVERLKDMENGKNRTFDKRLMIKFSHVLDVDATYFINDKIVVSDIAANMRCIREISGRTVEDMAKKSGMKFERCIEIDNGSQPTLSEVSKFAEYYKIPEQWVINFDFQQICQDNRVRLAFYILSLTEEMTEEQLNEFKHYLEYILKV